MAQVLIIMGSDSDLPVMAEAAEVLDIMGVSYKLTVVSAHRTPTRMYDYAQAAEQSGIKVIIAGAGGAAHLPGMVASITNLPVIGVPIKSSNMSGLDSLYSIVQMPPGIPVATMAINGAKNAAIFAAKILGTSDQGIMEQVKSYSARQTDSVLQKVEKLENQGYKKYLENL